MAADQQLQTIAQLPWTQRNTWQDEFWDGYYQGKVTEYRLFPEDVPPLQKPLVEKLLTPEEDGTYLASDELETLLFARKTRGELEVISEADLNTYRATARQPTPGLGA